MIPRCNEAFLVRAKMHNGASNITGGRQLLHFCNMENHRFELAPRSGVTLQNEKLISPEVETQHHCVYESHRLLLLQQLYRIARTRT
uniref:Uncharacterized protein n=1 Tax=Trichogramma kaykai TaxID=54128 RepID=A0ABD2XKX1_9HYME